MQRGLVQRPRVKRQAELDRSAQQRGGYRCRDPDQELYTISGIGVLEPQEPKDGDVHSAAEHRGSAHESNKNLVKGGGPANEAVQKKAYGVVWIQYIRFWYP